MRLSWTRRAGAVFLAGSLSGCGTMAEPVDATGLDGTAWVLSGLSGRVPVAPAIPTLQFAGGLVSGSDGCNRYSGPYTVTGTALRIGPSLAATQMACPPDVATQARAYLSVLRSADSHRIADGRLELLAADGQVLATFAVQSRSLAGTAWRITGINNGKGGVVSVLPDTTVTLSFSADGRASGSAGCNDYTGAYRAEGSTLAFAQAAATRKMCMQPAGVMDQEQRFLNALVTVATARVEGERLELRTAAGALAVSAVRGE